MNLTDDFLINCYYLQLYGITINRVMSDATYGEEFAKILLGTIFHREIGPLVVIPQKVEYGIETECHGIRLDVYMEEKDAGIFDMEAD